MGIQAFFQTHECSKACKGLLKPVKLTYDHKDCERIMRQRVGRSGIEPSEMRYH